MRLAEFSIRRHVFTLMVSLALLIFGGVSLSRLGVDRYPDVEVPVVSVATVLPGANPEVVDQNVTDVLEEAVNEVSGLELLRSTSSPSVSVITAEFELDKDIDVAAQEVRDKISGSRDELPDDAEEPVVRKVEVGGSAVMWLSLQGNRTQQQLNTYALEQIQPQLQTIQGVGQIQIGGHRERTIRIWLDSDQLTAHDVTAREVVGALENQHLELPGGYLQGQEKELVARFDAEYGRVADMRDLIVAYRGGAPVRLRDVARVEDGLADRRELARFNGEPTVGLGVVKVSGANTVAVIDEVKRRLPDIRGQLPPGMRLTISTDDSQYIREAIRALGEHILLGTLFAALIVLAFLRSPRLTVLIAVTIPLSLMATFAIMYFVGFTVNTMTLLGLLLLVGIVVDDAIVVLENIYRHLERGQDPDGRSAAVNGTNQVAFAVLAATLAVVAVFGPVTFIGGMVGRFLSEFALVVAFGVLVSLYLSLTLTPTLARLFLRIPRRHGRVYAAFGAAFDALERGYSAALRVALRYRWSVLGGAVLIVAGSIPVFQGVGKTFLPAQDESRFMVRASAPLGSTIDYTDRKLARIEEILGQQESVRSFFSAIGQGRRSTVTDAIAFVRMVPREEREISQQELMARLRRQLGEIPGIRVFLSDISAMRGQRGEPLQFAIQGPDLQRLDRLDDRIIARLEEGGGIVGLDTELQLDLPEVHFSLDREKAAALGLQARDLAEALNILSAGVDGARFEDGGDRYDIRVQLPPEERSTADAVKRAYVRGQEGQMVRLDNLVDSTETLGPATIPRLDRQYAAYVYGTPEEVTLGEAVSRVRAAAAEVLPSGYRVTFLGQAEEFQETAANMVFAFGLGIVLIYMVLASQFNRFLHPLLVMIALPLAIIGGLVALYVSGSTLNIFSMIGMTLLMGLVAKNSILLIDFTNQLRDQGYSVRDSLLTACPIRMRPVLMTSFTIIFAMLPAALGTGAGAEINGPIAVAVIGGVLSSTVLTLLVVPPAYSLLEGGLARLARWRGRSSGSSSEGAEAKAQEKRERISA